MPEVSHYRKVQPGAWVNPNANRYSGRICPACGFWLHQLLIEAGRRYHWLCGPPPERNQR